MKITFRQIDAFRTVTVAGTVPEAARMLGVSQPAAGRLILDLGEQVGFRLLRRVGRFLIPSDTARLLAEELRRALSGPVAIWPVEAALVRTADRMRPGSP